MQISMSKNYEITMSKEELTKAIFEFMSPAMDREPREIPKDAKISLNPEGIRIYWTEPNNDQYQLSIDME